MCFDGDRIDLRAVTMPCYNFLMSLTSSDLADIKQLMNGLLSQYMRGVDEKFEKVNKRFDAVDDPFTQVDRQFGAIDQRFDGIDERLNKS